MAAMPGCDDPAVSAHRNAVLYTARSASEKQQNTTRSKASLFSRKDFTVETATFDAASTG